jgi:predicted phage baseplate assembly protein
VQSDDGRSWSVVQDLLSSGAEDARFIPEIEYDGSVFLRFGDGQYGATPDSGLSFTASYRIGNGTVGNIGRDTLAHVVFGPNAIRSVRNPLTAAGGTDPEDMQHIRQYAPFAFQTQERCVTEADYGQMAAQSAAISQARGTLRWTGSWYTAFVSVEPVATLTAQLVSDTTRRLNLLRMMGTDLAVEGAVIVGLNIQLQICVAPDHFQGDVYAALMQVFISGDQCNGSSGLLNAANFTFGEIVYASPLIAAAQAVDGVVTATLEQFTRMDDPSIDGVALGYLSMGPLQIARCDNDPNHLDHGLFSLQLDGGK